MRNTFYREPTSTYLIAEPQKAKPQLNENFRKKSHTNLISLINQNKKYCYVKLFQWFHHTLSTHTSIYLGIYVGLGCTKFVLKYIIQLIGTV